MYNCMGEYAPKPKCQGRAQCRQGAVGEGRFLLFGGLMRQVFAFVFRVWVKDSHLLIRVHGFCLILEFHGP